MELNLYNNRAIHPMIDNSNISNNTKNEIVLISATSEQIPNTNKVVNPISGNIDIANATLCCLILLNNFCIMIFILINENFFWYVIADLFLQSPSMSPRTCYGDSKGDAVSSMA